MKLSRPDDPLRPRPEIKAAVESIAERGEVARRILLEAEGMVRPRQAGLKIAKQGIDPVKLGHRQAGLELDGVHGHGVILHLEAIRMYNNSARRHKRKPG